MDIVYCSIMLFCGCFSYLVVFTFSQLKVYQNERQQDRSGYLLRSSMA